MQDGEHDEGVAIDRNTVAEINIQIMTHVGQRRLEDGTHLDIWIILDDVYVDFCRGTSASGCPVLLFTYIHFTRSWVGLKGRPCSQS